MDGNRFDDLSRTLAAGLSRRTALRGAVAGLLGALGLRHAAEAEVTQAFCGNVVCASNPGICKPGCVCCVYGNGNSRCMPPSKCGQTGGTLTCPAGQQFCTITADCAECCGDLSCDDGIACTTDTCNDGVCTHTPNNAACPEGAVCDPELGCVCPPFQRLVEGECVFACSLLDCTDPCHLCAAAADGSAFCFGVIGPCGAECTSDAVCLEGQSCLKLEVPDCGVSPLGFCLQVSCNP